MQYECEIQRESCNMVFYFFHRDGLLLLWWMNLLRLYIYIYQNPFYYYGCLFYFNKILLFHFNENLHELCLQLNIMHVCLLFYIVDDLVCRVWFTH